MRRWRLSTWLILLWTVAMLVWVISAGASGSNCANQTGAYQHAKQTGCEAGTGIAVFAILIIWFLGYIPLGIVWFARRGRQSPAPTQPPAGWYPDPWRQSAQRWWDGSQWTQHVA